MVIDQLETYLELCSGFWRLNEPDVRETDCPRVNVTGNDKNGGDTIILPKWHLRQRQRNPPASLTQSGIPQKTGDRPSDACSTYNR